MNALWAVGYPITAIALKSGATPTFLAAIRLLVAFLMLLPWLWRIRGWSWRLIGFGAFMGIVGFTVPVWLQTLGIARANPAVAALSISAEPLFTVGLASVLTGSRMTMGQRAALVVALVGAWILTGEPRPGSALNLGGDAALFGAVLGFALFNVYSERLFTWVGAGGGAALTFGFGALGSAWVWIGQGSPMPGALTFPLIWSVGFMAVGATGAAYLLWLYAVGRQSVATAALFLYTQPLLGTLLSWALGQAQLTLNLALGGLLVLVGMTLNQLGSRDPAAKAQP